MKKYRHPQILTDDKTIEIGRNYTYFKDLPSAIACVEVLEDNSDDKYIKFKLKIIKPLHQSLFGQENLVFECASKIDSVPYDGMWFIKNFNVDNVRSAMSPPKDESLVMDIEHVKTVCKIGAGGECCRYLTMGSKGFECGNLDDSMRTLLDERAESGQMNAIGKNCGGYKKQQIA